jgi:hypothetical protein
MTARTRASRIIVVIVKSDMGTPIQTGRMFFTNTPDNEKSQKISR